jgi:hypothetical protein
MKPFCKSLILILLLVSSAFGSVAQESHDDVSRLIAVAKFLEQTPFDKKAKDVRKWALTWVIATDKVSVNLCGSLVSGVNKGKEYKYSGEMTAQYAIGMAAFKLANPGKDEQSAQLAGYESVLSVYDAMMKEQPKAKNAFLDELLAKRADGTLAQYLAENNCKGMK